MLSALVGLALVVVGVIYWVSTVISGKVALAILMVAVGALAFLGSYPLLRRKE